MVGATLGETIELLKVLAILVPAASFGTGSVILLRALARHIDRQPLKWLRGPGFGVAFKDGDQVPPEDSPVFVYLSPDQLGGSVEIHIHPGNRPPDSRPPASMN